MAKKSLRIKAASEPKFEVRRYNRCPLCGRVRAFLRRFHMCRICFRFHGLRGDIPGVTKSSW
ncbi:type Z 30S ribosomal protein S14 [Candidatus Nitronereus thalassa]|uniref:Small ribosomal subunit protein uS14 n=1 Tax=Candidatus Nitronereus thalassa TaxID=3020898 RepID=A0ABU3KBH8_9BACT|nr:type Z 30S ribosomal protein S14 [Candidatus Nitronereus thalassa]MDT7043844.1 type Z 30S ribosomal protein S14 [Candidatus Nitronereus thalassa]